MLRTDPPPATTTAIFNMIGTTATLPTLRHQQDSPCDAMFLSLSLVKDGALPAGYEQTWFQFADVPGSGLDRQRPKPQCSISKGAQQEGVTSSKKKFQCGLLRLALYAKPTARLDAKASKRTRCLRELASVFVVSQTPMGQLLAAQPSNIELFDGGRRASTLQGRVRGVKEFIVHLSDSCNVSSPTTSDHFEHMKLRLSEPCVRSALNTAGNSSSFLEVVCGMQKTARVTSSQIYHIVFDELLSTAAPGSPLAQAPRLFISIVDSLESLVTNQQQTALYLQVDAWWMLLQC